MKPLLYVALAYALAGCDAGSPGVSLPRGSAVPASSVTPNAGNGTAIPPVTEQHPEHQHHVVQQGEFLGKIAEMHAVTLDGIVSCNALPDKDHLEPGQSLKLYENYTVKEGDTLSGIAARLGATLSEIIRYNQEKIGDKDTIIAGSVYRVPCQRAAYSINETEMAQEESKHTYVKGKKGKKKSASVPQKHKGKKVRFPSGLELEVVRDVKLTGRRKEFYDPNNSGNPLLRVRKNDLSRHVSDHFVLGEFAIVRDPVIVRMQYTQRYGGDLYHQYIRLDSDLIQQLEQLRKRVDRPLVIQSGYRPYGYNNRLYHQRYGCRPTISRHISGDGVDVLVPSKDLKQKFNDQVERVFRRGGVGKGSSFTHVDVRGRKARWRY
ncbi:MAG: LysM peptidoglycan-binding domain-containing protein [Nanoarchaeota archaeon]